MTLVHVVPWHIALKVILLNDLLQDFQGNSSVGYKDGLHIISGPRTQQCLDITLYGETNCFTCILSLNVKPDLQLVFQMQTDC